jgi:bifunctional non-homologous end joining protein LigD
MALKRYFIRFKRVWQRLRRTRLLDALDAKSLRPPHQVGMTGQVAAVSPQRLHHAIPGVHPGGQWLHEIKHDGFRIIARKDGDRVRLYSRPGNDFTRRFPLIAKALTGLRSRSCIIDGEAVACDDNGLASFERIRYRQHDGDVFLYAFDLIELNGDDLRRDPLQVRKATLASILAKARPAFGSTSISRAMARRSSPTPARWGSKASCPSARTRCIAPAARRIGSK